MIASAADGFFEHVIALKANQQSWSFHNTKSNDTIRQSPLCLGGRSHEAYSSSSVCHSLIMLIMQHAYFDVKVFNPIAATYRNKTLKSCYRRLEAGKRREYQDRILNVEHGSFSPLIFTTAGGMGPTASVVFQRLASLLSAKRNEHYSKTILFIRCQIGFALLRSAIRCLRGSRSTFTPDLANTCMDLALTEGRVAY